MNETILAYNLGYRVNKSGELYLGGVPINYIVKYRKKKNGRNLLVFYLSNGKTVYVSKLQAYQKYGDSALKENCLYIDGNTSNCSYDNITIKTEFDKYLTKNNKYYLALK